MVFFVEVPMPEIKARVGEDGENNESDVRIIQELLIKNKVFAGPVTGECDDATIAAIKAFQEKFMSNPDGNVDPHGKTLKRLNGATSQFKIVRGANFKTADDGAHLDPELLRRVTEFAQYLIDHDYVTGDIVFTQGVRNRKTAHRWSTSWNIRKGRVPLKNLQDLDDGKDLDGNQWYDAAWEEGLATDPNEHLTKESLQKLWAKIKANAKQYYSSDAIAAEGYPTTDDHIKPNVHPVVSNHVGGNAMDVSIPWRSGAAVGTVAILEGQTTDQAANALIARFGLSRPVPSEKWHIQLAATQHLNSSTANITGEAPQNENPHP
jgi:peptidoglycan hydrolase-like protein with peptidoglycan-binding domain